MVARARVIQASEAASLNVQPLAVSVRAPAPSALARVCSEREGKSPREPEAHPNVHLNGPHEAQPEAHLNAQLEAQIEAQIEAEVARRLAARVPEVPRTAQLHSALLRDELLALGKVLAERLIGEKLALEPQAMSLLATEVLSEARGARRIQLSVSESDLAALRGDLPRLCDWFSADIELGVDPTLRRGDLRISSELGQSDARIDTRLNCLLELLR